METLQSERFTIRPGEPQGVSPRCNDAKTTLNGSDVERQSRRTGTRQNENLDCADIQNSAALTDHQGEEQGRPLPDRTTEFSESHPTGESREIKGSPVDSEKPAIGNGNFVTRSITEPIRKNTTYDERFNRADNGMIAFWEAGRACAASNRTENPWRKGTNNYTAWQQGFEGFDLCVCLTQPEPKPATTKPKPQPAGSLF